MQCSSLCVPLSLKPKYHNLISPASVCQVPSETYYLSFSKAFGFLQQKSTSYSLVLSDGREKANTKQNKTRSHCHCRRSSREMVGEKKEHKGTEMLLHDKGSWTKYKSKRRLNPRAKNRSAQGVHELELPNYASHGPLSLPS